MDDSKPESDSVIAHDRLLVLLGVHRHLVFLPHIGTKLRCSGSI